MPSDEDQTMRAAIYSKTGPAKDVLRIARRPIPDAGEGEVLVRVYASGVNPSDTKRRMGYIPQFFEIIEVVPHTDAAGVVEAVGATVDEALIGQRVWVHSAQVTAPNGTAADFVVVPLAKIAPLPDGVRFEEGATLGVPLLTAWRSVDLAGDIKGKTVLITGGAGAVGNYAIQLAKLKGAKVIATVSSSEKATVAKTAGADQIINYRSDDVAGRVSEITNGRGVDLYIEVNLSANVGNIPALIARGADVVIYGSDAPSVALEVFALGFKQARLHFVLVYFIPEDEIARAKTELTELMRAAKLTYPIAETFPLEEIVQAHDAVEKGALGNVVVTCA